MASLTLSCQCYHFCVACEGSRPEARPMTVAVFDKGGSLVAFNKQDSSSNLAGEQQPYYAQTASPNFALLRTHMVR